MKTSAQAMKQTVKEADLDKAEDLMDDIQEAMDQVQEMNDAMSQPIGYLNDIDDAELEAELDELDQLDADELLTAAPDPPMKSQAMDNSSVLADLPAAPTKKVAASLVFACIFIYFGSVFYIDIYIYVFFSFAFIFDFAEEEDEDAQLAELEAMMS